MSTGGTSAMVTGLTMAQRALFLWGLSWLVASCLIHGLEFPKPHSKRSLDTCNKTAACTCTHYSFPGSGVHF
jgi:hypothetical protein